MTFIVIETTEETRECLDTLEANFHESGICLEKLKKYFSDERDTDNRAWLVRFLIDREAKFAEGDYTVDPDLFQDTVPRKRPKIKGKRRTRGGRQ